MNKKYPTFFLTWFNKFSRVPYPGEDQVRFDLVFLHLSFDSKT